MIIHEDYSKKGKDLEIEIMLTEGFAIEGTESRLDSLKNEFAEHSKKIQSYYIGHKFRTKDIKGELVIYDAWFYLHSNFEVFYSISKDKELINK